MGEREHARLAFEIAKSQLSGQKQDLMNFRNQASFAAAFSGLVAAAFTNIIQPGDLHCSGVSCFLGLSISAWLAFSLLFLSLGASTLVITGWRSCKFELNPKWVLDAELSGLTLEEALTKLAEDADLYFDENEEVISEARANLQLSLVFGLAQIPAWVLSV